MPCRHFWPKHEWPHTKSICLPVHHIFHGGVQWRTNTHQEHPCTSYLMVPTCHQLRNENTVDLTQNTSAPTTFKYTRRRFDRVNGRTVKVHRKSSWPSRRARTTPDNGHMPQQRMMKTFRKVCLVVSWCMSRCPAIFEQKCQPRYNFKQNKTRTKHLCARCVDTCC